ncbi:MAG: D-tyrosyl-tRNA(Tyr) deacylase [Acidobacteria bacterium]|nr:D-tyrosyl-tRNA(Tyr) deacylase [Acidobacteriota bacterium]
MRAVVQRVSAGKVTVDGKVIGEIGAGLVILLGVSATDSVGAADLLARKIAGLRIFSDDEGRFNHSALDVRAELLVVSQFTLYADCRRGRRPSFSEAARPELAVPLYEAFICALREMGLRVATGQFQAMMAVDIHNDGPVTICLDTDQLR